MTAIDLAKRDGARGRFVEADLYETPQVVLETFDLVYTSGGVLWGPGDIRGCAIVVSRLLKPGGVFYIREAHPMLWSLEDEHEDEQLAISLPRLLGVARQADGVGSAHSSNSATRGILSRGMARLNIVASCSTLATLAAWPRSSDLR